MKAVFTFIFLILFINIENKINNLCIDTNDNCFKKEKKKVKKMENYEKEMLINKYPSSFTFILDSLYNKLYSSTSIYKKYIDGFTHICNTAYKIYYSYKHKDDIQIEDFRNLIEENNIEEEKINDFNNLNFEDSLNENSFRKLEDEHDNNTNLYDSIICPSKPDIKAKSYIFYCNNTRVDKDTYEKLKNITSQKCEFYINIIKICFCPINYYNCLDNKIIKPLYCKIQNLTANNNKYDLLKGRETFYYEFTNRTILPLSQKKYKFTINVLCGNPTSISLKDNFYISIERNNTYDYVEFTSIENLKSDQQLSFDDIKNKSKEILNYYYKEKKFVVYDEFKLELSFTIYEMQYIYPYKTFKFEIDSEKGKKFLSGENFSFEIDLNDLDKKENLNEIFTNKKYKAFLNGDIYYYEIKIYDKLNDNIVFFSYLGEIDKKS